MEVKKTCVKHVVHVQHVVISLMDHMYLFHIKFMIRIPSQTFYKHELIDISLIILYHAPDKVYGA